MKMKKELKKMIDGLKKDFNTFKDAVHETDRMNEVLEEEGTAKAEHDWLMAYQEEMTARRRVVSGLRAIYGKENFDKEAVIDMMYSRPHEVYEQICLMGQADC